MTLFIRKVKLASNNIFLISTESNHDIELINDNFQWIMIGIYADI